MDSEELRSILSRSRVDIWSLIETAIRVANADYGEELRHRRDKIVQALYTPAAQPCGNRNGSVRNDVLHCHPPYNPGYIKSSDDSIIENSNDEERKFDKDSDDKFRNSNRDFVSKSALTPESNHRNLSDEEEEDLDPFGGLFDDEQTTILNIKEQLEDPNQSEDTVVELLQNLADIDITYQALEETDIGRHVNGLRKHPSNEVRILVKQLVRKWKETVDEWVKVNQPKVSSNVIADEDSPQRNVPKIEHNGHSQVPDFGFSPNPRSGSSSVERNYTEHQTKAKAPQSTPRTQPSSRPPKSVPKAAYVPPNRAPKETADDDERLNSASRRLQENYQEANNAKKQRTIQVMDIHEIPRPKNGFFAKNRGGFQGRHHR